MSCAGSCESRLQRIDGRLGENKLLAAQNVVDVDALDRQHVDLGNVARRLAEMGLRLGPVDDQRIGEAELGEIRLERFGLGFADLGIGPDYDSTVARLCRERMFQGKHAHFLRQVMRMRAHERTEGAAAATELRHPRGTMASIAGPLLPVHFLARAGDLAAPLRLVGAGAALGELIAYHARENIFARLEAEDRVVKLDRACVAAVEAGYVDFHGAAPSAGLAVCSGAAGAAPSASLNLPGRGASFGRAFFTASRI